MKLPNIFSSIRQYVVYSIVAMLLGSYTLFAMDEVPADKCTLKQSREFMIAEFRKLRSTDKTTRKSSELYYLYDQGFLPGSLEPYRSLVDGEIECSYSRANDDTYGKVIGQKKMDKKSASYESVDPFTIEDYNNVFYVEKPGNIPDTYVPKFIFPEELQLSQKNQKYKNIYIPTDDDGTKRLQHPVYQVLKLAGINYTKEEVKNIRLVLTNAIVRSNNDDAMKLHNLAGKPTFGIPLMYFFKSEDEFKKLYPELYIPFQRLVHEVFRNKLNFTFTRWIYDGFCYFNIRKYSWGEKLYRRCGFPNQVSFLDIYHAIFNDSNMGSYSKVVQEIVNYASQINAYCTSRENVDNVFDNIKSFSMLLWICLYIVAIVLGIKLVLAIWSWLSGGYRLPYGVKSNLTRDWFIVRWMKWLDRNTFGKLGYGFSTVPIEENFVLDDFVGSEELTDQVRSLVKTYEYVVQANKEAVKRGESLFLNLANALLLGPPGTGKTMLTKIIVQILSEKEGVNFLVIDSTTLSGMSVQERADFWAYVKEHRNPANPLIVVFNDVDQILQGTSDWHRDFLGLVDKSGDPGYCFIFTTNLPRADIKANVLSRIEREITVLAPDLEESLEILEKNMRSMAKQWDIKLLFDVKGVREHDYFSADEPPVGRDVLSLVERALVAVNKRSIGKGRKRALSLAHFEAILDKAQRDKLQATNYDDQLFKDEQERVKKAARDAAVLRDEYQKAMKEKMGNIVADKQAQLTTTSFGSDNAGSTNTMMLVMMMMMTLIMLLGMGGAGFVVYQYISGRNKDDQ